MAVGKIEPFDANCDIWSLYVDRLEQYFLINSVKDELKVPMLITLIGGSSYELLVTLCAPKKPSELKYDDVVQIMLKHLQPTPSVLAERYRFRQRTQARSESISDYVTALKKLARTCGFQTVLDDNLRDQFVCGIFSDGIRQRLFAEDEINFTKAYKLAHALEAAELNAAAVNSHRKNDEGTVACQAITSEPQRDGGRQRNRAPAGAGGTRARARYSGGEAGGSSGAPGAPSAAAASWTPNTGHSRGPRAGGASRGRGAGGGSCRACGGQHVTTGCKFRVYACRICNREGHLKRMCPKLGAGGASYADGNYVEEVNISDSDESVEVITPIYNLSGLKRYKPYTLSLQLNNKMLTMEIDTGSTISCISLDCYRTLFTDCKLIDSELLIRYYTGETVKVVGKIRPLVKYNDKLKELNLYIVNDARTALMGREWIEELGIVVPGILYNTMVVEEKFNLHSFSSRYAQVFEDGLGRFTGEPVGLRLRAGAVPVFMRARPLAFALRAPVDRALDQMVRDGIITPVECSDWATPIVPVVKTDGSIRICADYKLTLNKWLEIDRYPVPRIDDLLVKLNGGDKFSKIDLSQAYAQFPLDDTKEFTTINTHKGLFQYNRLVYGLASSPGIFQRKLEQMFADLPTVGVYLDDVIITATNDKEHMNILCQVFDRLLKYGLKIKKEKCVFFAESVTYLGFVISRDGVSTCPSKVDVINRMFRPQNVTELRSFLGMIMYYAKFVKNISTTLSPLYELLRKDVKFVWSEDCQRSFEKVKTLLQSSEVLAHYSSELPLVLTTDASSTGVGAVIAHRTTHGERPIAYASRVLSPAEQHYSQIEKEGLSIIYGVQKFHQYLYGRKFLLKTDHKPLVTIFGDKVGIPKMAASRLQRWAVIMSGYHYDIEYVRSEDNGADALSRLITGPDKKMKSEITYLNYVQNFLPVKSIDVKKATSKDPILVKVLMYIASGWPTYCNDENLKPYFIRRNELYMEAGCILWGYRVVVPAILQDKILQELHLGHVGMVKMKSTARSYVWWPGIDAAVEHACRACAVCVAESSAPPRAPPQPWPYIVEPWTRLHVDFLGPIEKETFFVIVDSTTKWIEIFHMTRTTTSAVVKVLCETFARFGLPKSIVSDNALQFCSAEYDQFLKSNGIEKILTPTYHPSSNGAAENAVKLCKKAIKKAKRENVDVDIALQAYLMSYRNAIHGTTGESPALLLQKRRLRCRLDLLRGGDERERTVHRAQTRQVQAAGGRERRFQVGDQIYMREQANPDRWVQGRIKEGVGSRNYLVERSDGSLVKKHVDQLKHSSLVSNRLVWPRWDTVLDGDTLSGPEDGAGAAAEPACEHGPTPAAATEQAAAPLPVSRAGRPIKPVKYYPMPEFD